VDFNTTATVSNIIFLAYRATNVCVQLQMKLNGINKLYLELEYKY